MELPLENITDKLQYQKTFEFFQILTFSHSGL